MKIFALSIKLVLFASVLVVAQPHPQNPPPDPDPVPITGIEYLLISGGAYGIYRFSKKRKKKNPQV
jgi:hypothetical protein